MIRIALAAATLLLAAPAAAQSQADLDARYDRALAAGYKAMFLCSAIATAGRAGTTRTPESVMEWELAGIQAPLDAMVAELPYTIARARGGSGVLTDVRVQWADDMPPRIAWHEPTGGCTLGPIGIAEPPPRATLPRSNPDVASVRSQQNVGEPMAPVFDRAFAQGYGEGTRTTAVIVAGPTGDALFSRYADGFGPATPQRTWSVAKSLAATLIGAAVQRGEIDVTASAGLGAGDGDPRRAITIDQLLRMASGRYSDTSGNRTDPVYFGGATVDERSAVWPLVHAPGSTFRYANNDTLMAIGAIEETFADHPPAELFATLGMHGTVAETDWQGNYILSSQVWSTAPDLMRLGQLYLNGGVWNGKRILPEGWVEFVSDPSGPQPEGEFGYGAGWWTFAKEGSRIEGVPDDAFAARGNRGQFVVVVPSRDLVIVRRGEDPVGASFDLAGFTRDLLAAMPDR